MSYVYTYLRSACAPRGNNVKGLDPIGNNSKGLEPRGNILKGLKDFHLKARIRILNVSCVPSLLGSGALVLGAGLGFKVWG